jgi:hypothetical protein
MGVSHSDSGLLVRDDRATPLWRFGEQEHIMQAAIKYLSPWLAAAAIGAAVGLAPAASATTGSTPVPQSQVVAHSAPSPRPAPKPYETGPDPLVPYGTDPYVPFRLGYYNPNHDEGNTTNGQVDVPF